MKKNKLIIVIILIVCLLSFVALLFISDKEALRGGDKVAVISLSGPIADEAQVSPFATGGITPSSVRSQLNRAKNDLLVKAVVLKIDSPGGAVGASQEIAREIKDFEKPIVVFMGDMAASGGYYISCQADKIVAKPGTLVGSIGVISQFMDLTGLYEKLGIKVKIIKSGKHKDMFARIPTPEEEKMWQELSDELYEQFIKEVAEGRNLKVEKVKELATGQLYSGVRAKKLGLVDKLGSYQDAIDLAAELAKIKEPTIDEYGPPTFLEQLLGLSSAEIKGLICFKLYGKDYFLLKYLENQCLKPKY